MPETPRLKVSQGRAITLVAVLPWFALGFVALLAHQAFFVGEADPALATLDAAGFLPFVAIGFAAQLVDGALGMGFGVVSNALLLMLGTTPSRATSGVHTAESFASGISAISHARAGNIDWRLFSRLVLPGIIGGILGAVAITAVDAAIARPVVLAYLALIGLRLAWRALRMQRAVGPPRLVQSLGFVGGFFDAAGGGGWGPIVAGNLLLQGSSPAKVVGTVNLSEFFVTVAISLTFVTALGVTAFTAATLGLMLGGVVAAPIAALLTKRLPPRFLAVTIGVLIFALAVAGLVQPALAT